MRRLFAVFAFTLLVLTVVPISAVGQDRVTTITIIYDNYAYVDGLETDWGFSALIETGAETILFDTGTRGDMLLKNFSALGKDPAQIDVLVFSHDHGDHTGGMESLFETGIRPPTYVLSSFNAEVRNQVSELTTAIETQPGDEILAGIFTTGQVGDAIPEQALVIPTADGLVVLTGCAHAGVVAMLERVRELSPERIHLVMGGFHLSGAGIGRIAATVTTVRGMGIERVGATHCTGEVAIAEFADEYGDDFVRLGVGRVLTFPAVR